MNCLREVKEVHSFIDITTLNFGSWKSHIRSNISSSNLRMHLAEQRPVACSCEYGNELSGSIKGREFTDCE